MKWAKIGFCFLPALVLLNSCDSIPSVGPGVIHFHDDFSQRLYFYDNPDTLSKPAFYVDVIFEDTVRRILTSLHKQRDALDFYPFYKTEASVSLQVSEQKGDWFKVYTDDLVGVMHWVYVDDREIEGWRSFWPTVKYVISDDQSNPLRANPSDNAKAFSLRSQRLCLMVLEVQGAWLKVRNSPDRCPDAYVIQDEFEGFLRWKKEDRIVVSFQL